MRCRKIIKTAETYFACWIVMTALSREEQNFVRMTFLLIDISTRALRLLFNKEFAASRLKSTLQNAFIILLDLKSRKIINKDQWNYLFPKTGDPNSNKFDATLMICLIRNLTGCPKPRKGFESLPEARDTTKPDDLARIKFYRNKLAHKIDNVIDNNTFVKEWEDISEAIHRLSDGQMDSECQELKNKLFDQSIQGILQELMCLRQKVDILMEGRRNAVPNNMKEKIDEIIEDWLKRDQKFVENRGSKAILKCIKKMNCVTITGSSGIGKTATLIHVVLQMKKEGFEIVPIFNPNDVIKYSEDKKKIMFIRDDFCGKYSVNQTEIDLWKSQMDYVKQLLQKDIKIIVACRLQIYQDVKFEILSIFRSCECDLLSEKFVLLHKEKIMIAKMHLKQSADNILSYNKFDCFPLLCSLCADNPTLDIREFFERPFIVYEKEIDKMYAERDYQKYCCLALIVVFNNQLEEEWFVNKKFKEKHSIIKSTCEACKVNSSTSRLALRDDLDSLLKTFIKKQDGVYSAIHDKIFDFLVYYFGKKIPSSLIENAESHLIRERFLLSEGIDISNDQFVIEVSEEYHGIYIERIIDDLSHGEVVNVLSNINMTSHDFRQELLRTIKMKFKKDEQHEMAQQTDKGNHDTVLIRSCFSENVDFIKWCFSHGVDINAVRYDQTTPLFIACQKGYLEIVKMLLRKGAIINMCSVTGASPLLIACQEGYSEIVELLLENDADIQACIETGESPLFIACQDGYPDIVKMLLKRGANVNDFGDKQMVPLVIACQENHLQIVKILLENKANINACTETGTTPLYIACERGHTKIVECLLNSKPNRNGKVDVNKCINTKASPLFIAAQEGHLHVVDLLLKNNAKTELCRENLASPLFIASQEGHKEIVKCLLHSNAYIDKCNSKGESPLFIACQEGQNEIVHILLNENANVDKYKETGATPLFIACQLGRTRIVKILLDHNANVNLCTNYGKSPLFIASQEGYTEIVKMLLNRNADISKRTKDNEKHTALDIAVLLGHTEIQRLIKNPLYC